jgi:sec-independent protein translocase protein TatA
MGGFSLWHWLVVIILVLLLFGRGRISDMMGDIGKGLKSFKKGLAEDEEAQPGEKRQLPPQGQAPERPIDVSPEPTRESPPSDDQPRG